MNSEMLQALRDVMVACLNTPYIWGGNNPLVGLDCSGFVIWSLRSIGVWKGGDDSAQGLYGHYKLHGIEHTLHDVREDGDLLFFGADRNNITHVAIAAGETLMFEAGGAGSKCKTPADAAAAGAMVRIRPVSSRKDLVAICSPWATKQ